MDDQEKHAMHARRLASLEDRMSRMETMMQEVLIHLGIHTRGTAGINPVAVPPQERPEIRAIREALSSGDKIKAIKLYRSFYGVSLKEAQDAINTM
jgi:ribosomal protein L7/L12